MRTHDIDTNDTGLPIPGRELDPPRSQALEDPVPVVKQTLTAAAAPVDLVERLAAIIETHCHCAARHEPLAPHAAAYAILAELAATGGEAPNMPKLAYVARAAFDRACAFRDADPFEHVVMRVLQANGHAPILAAKDARLAEQAMELSGLQNAYEDEREERRMLTACVGDLEKERDTARAKVAELEAEAEKQRRRENVLLAVGAANYANDMCSTKWSDDDVELARDVLDTGIATKEWHRAVLEYAAKARQS